MTKTGILQTPTWSDRNSLGLDRTGEVRALKPRSKQLMDAVRGRLNEHIDVPQRDIYEPEMNIQNFVKLVPLKYKDEYIAQKKENALNFLSNPKLLGHREYATMESWQYYFHTLSINPTFMDLRDYHNLKRIDKEDGREKRLIEDEEIHRAIELFLEKKSAEILAYIQKDSGREDLIDHGIVGTQKKIFAWALSNAKFSYETISQLHFDDESADDFIKKYGSNIEFELFDAITKELESQGTEEIQ